MNFLVGLGIALATTVAMEGVAYAAHRFIMHGPAWAWHRSHHEAHDHPLEKNDLFAAIFGAFALGLVLVGSAGATPLYWIGLGMTLYGLLYFFVHDGLVHQRWPFRHNPKQAYLKRLVQAHRLHHAVEGRDGCVSFGFLYAPPIGRLIEVLRRTRAAARMKGR